MAGRVRGSVVQADWNKTRAKAKAKAEKAQKAEADKALKALAKRRKAAGFPEVSGPVAPVEATEEAEVEETEADTEAQDTENK